MDEFKLKELSEIPFVINQEGTSIKDSGNRTVFVTGAVRDISEDKGRCDLLPLGVLADIFNTKLTRHAENTSAIFQFLEDFMLTKDSTFLIFALNEFCFAKGWDLPTAILEVSIHYRDGAKKYGEENWRLGIPVSSFLDSAIRHYLKWLRGDQDEPHDRAFVWNLLGAMWTLSNKKEMDDI